MGSKREDCPYKCRTWAEESHGKPLYCVTFNHVCPELKDYFATAGANRASVYRCLPDGGVELVQAYVDEDSAESFYVCKWTYDARTPDLDPLLLLAGEKGIVRVLNVATTTLLHSFRGHGNSVNDIAIHPERPYLIATASKDNSVRLWNLDTGVCVLVCTGPGAHTGETLSLDFCCANRDLFASSGMDSTVKIWSLHAHWAHIDASNAHQDGGLSFPTKQLLYPVFSSRQVHGNFVDCVRFVGELVLSKTVDRFIRLWRPNLPAPEDRRHQTSHTFTLLASLPVGDTGIWFLRFSLDVRCRRLAAGNKSGELWMHDPLCRSRKHWKLTHKDCRTPIRQAALSADGRVVVACCEDARLFRWDLVEAKA